MGLLNYFKSKRKLLKEYDKVCTKLGRMHQILKRQEVSSFYVWENLQDFVVLKQIRFKKEPSSVDILIKRFPKGDDLEYARLCANELLDELNKEI